MAQRKSDAEYWAERDAERRELEDLFARMRERFRREEEREERRRARLRRLTFGLLGRA
jgi:hypothetical protein